MVKKTEVPAKFKAFRIHLLLRRREAGVAARLLEETAVAVPIARVALEILSCAELEGVHEDARHHDIALGAGTAHEGEMALVQRAHGRTEPYRTP